MGVAVRLLIASGGGEAFVPPTPGPFPSAWTLTKAAGNPVIDVDDHPTETHEQYVPAVIEISPTEHWCYVKGSFNIYAYKSTDGMATWVLQNGGAPVIAKGSAGQWDEDAAVEPCIVYDSATGDIFVWYKGTSTYGAPAAEWKVGLAVASDSDPTDFTKDAGNPIWTDVDASGAIGYNVYDLAFSSVIKIGSTWHFYGYVLQGTSLGGALYTLTHATGSAPDTVDTFATIAHSGSTSIIYGDPDVFEIPGSSDYGMLYTYGSLSSTPRQLRLVTSPDGTTWSGFPGDVILAPVAASWEGHWAYTGSFLKENVAPFSALILDGSGRVRLMYSGESDQGGPQPGGHHDNTGLAYFAP